MAPPASPFRIFIGYDPREVVAYHVLCHSIIEHASIPVQFFALHKPLISDVHDRLTDGIASTAFSFSRFLTPYYCGYDGPALYLDCDMLVTSDIATLAAEARAMISDGHALKVVKHDYVPRAGPKFFEQTQKRYRRKNWSSVMLFDTSLCRTLTPGMVETASGMYLHQFGWLDDSQIGSLPDRWNFLVGEYEPPAEVPSLLHYTLGGPYLDGYADTDFADQWFAARDRMLSPIGRPS